MDLTTTVFDDPELTGGVPTIPANATNEGVVDVSKLNPGTVITLITRSMSKWALTVQQGGTVTIDYFIWFFGEFYSREDLRRDHEECERNLALSRSLQEQHPQLEIGYHHSGVSSYKQPVDFPGSHSIAEFSAGECLRNQDRSLSSPILFWSIEE